MFNILKTWSLCKYHGNVLLLQGELPANKIYSLGLDDAVLELANESWRVPCSSTAEYALEQKNRIVIK